MFSATNTHTPNKAISGTSNQKTDTHIIVGVQIKVEFNTGVSHWRDYDLVLQSVIVSRRTLIMQCIATLSRK